MDISKDDLQQANQLILKIIQSSIGYRQNNESLKSLLEASAKLTKESEALKALPDEEATKEIKEKNSRESINNDTKILAVEGELKINITEFKTAVKMLHKVPNIKEIEQNAIKGVLIENFSSLPGLKEKVPNFEENAQKYAKIIVDYQEANQNPDDHDKEVLESLSQLIAGPINVVFELNKSQTEAQRQQNEEFLKRHPKDITNIAEIADLHQYFLKNNMIDYPEVFKDWAGENGEKYKGLNLEILESFDKDSRKLSSIFSASPTIDDQYFDLLHKQSVIQSISKNINTVFHGPHPRITKEDITLISAGIVEYIHKVHPSQTGSNLIAASPALAAAVTEYILKQKDNNIFHARDAKVGQKITDLRREAISHAISKVTGTQSDYQEIYEAEQSAMAEQMAIENLHNILSSSTILGIAKPAVKQELAKIEGNDYVSKVEYLKKEVFEKALKGQATKIKDPLLMDLHKEFNEVSKKNPKATPEQLKQLMVSAARKKVQEDKKKTIEDYNKFVNKAVAKQHNIVQKLYEDDVAEQQSLYYECGLVPTDEELKRIQARARDNVKGRLAKIETETNKLRREHTTKRIEVASQGFEAAIAGAILGLPLGILTLGGSIIIGALAGMVLGSFYDYKKQQGHCEKKIEEKLEDLALQYKEADLEAKKTLRTTLEGRRDQLITNNKTLLNNLNAYKSGRTEQNPTPNKNITRIHGVYGEKHGIVVELRSNQKRSGEGARTQPKGKADVESKLVAFEINEADLAKPELSQFILKQGNKLFTIATNGVPTEVLKRTKNTEVKEGKTESKDKDKAESKDAKVATLYIDQDKVKEFKEALAKANITPNSETAQSIKTTFIQIGAEDAAAVMQSQNVNAVFQATKPKDQPEQNYYYSKDGKSFYLPVASDKADELIQVIQQVKQPAIGVDGALVREDEQYYLKVHRDSFKGKDCPLTKALAYLGITVEKAQDGMLYARDGQGFVMQPDGKGQGFYKIKLEASQLEAVKQTLDLNLGLSTAKETLGIQQLRNHSLYQQSVQGLQGASKPEEVKNGTIKAPGTTAAVNPNSKENNNAKNTGGGPSYVV